MFLHENAKKNQIKMKTRKNENNQRRKKNEDAIERKQRSYKKTQNTKTHIFKNKDA